MVEAYTLDDSYWREINIKAQTNNVCSYRLLNSNMKVDHNTFELQISDMENVQIGLYYGDKDNQIIDLKVFDQYHCQSTVPHCTSGNGFVQILAAHSNFLALSLIPKSTN